MNVENRTIFEGDNLHILRGLDSDSGVMLFLAVTGVIQDGGVNEWQITITFLDFT